jgi:hypothetical protein
MRNQPEEHEIQTEYYEANKYPWLEKVFANIRRKLSTRQKNMESKVILFIVTFFDLYYYYTFMNIFLLTLSHHTNKQFKTHDTP